MGTPFWPPGAEGEEKHKGWGGSGRQVRGERLTGQPRGAKSSSEAKASPKLSWNTAKGVHRLAAAQTWARATPEHAGLAEASRGTTKNTPPAPNGHFAQRPLPQPAPPHPPTSPLWSWPLARPRRKAHRTTNGLHALPQQRAAARALSPSGAQGYAHRSPDDLLSDLCTPWAVA